MRENPPVGSDAIYELTDGKELSIAEEIYEIIWKRFGLNDKLLKEIKNLSETVSPLGRLVFGKKTRRDMLVGNHVGEGRGTYHEDSNGNTIYVKGTGNEDLVKNGNNGFPVNENEFFHKFSDRIMGASDTVENVTEYINSCIIFSESAKENNWTDIDSAIRFGISIPLGLVAFKEISEKLRSLWNKSRLHKNNYKNLSWKKTGGIGTISLLVPGKNRISNHLHVDHKKQITNEDELLNPKLVKQISQTVRQLLKTGMIYYHDGFHAQNFFDSGNMSHADSSEMCFISNILESGVSESNLIEYLAEQLSEIDKPGLFEKSQNNNDFNDYVEYIKEFISGILGKDLNITEAKVFALFSSLDKTTFHRALAVKLFTEFNGIKWHQNAETQRLCLSKHPQSLERVNEKEKEFADRINSNLEYQISDKKILIVDGLIDKLLEAKQLELNTYGHNIFELLTTLVQLNKQAIFNSIFKLSKGTSSIYYENKMDDEKIRKDFLDLIKNKKVATFKRRIGKFFRKRFGNNNY